MTSSVNPLLQANLNPKQLLAAQTLEGPLLISAGAGSGKTKVLTYRIAQLIEQKKAHPDQILAITFTNKAANEMQKRAYQLLRDLNINISGKIWISTFHSLCASILRNNKLLINNSNTFTIYDNKDQLALSKKTLNHFNINEQSYHPKVLSSQIANCKRQGIGAHDINENNCPSYGGRFQELYNYYEQELKKNGAYDFEGLLFETNNFFLNFPDQLKRYQNQFLYICIDEYQDTNFIQYTIIKKLAKEHRNLCVVGDEDQSIYSWRGADISNILNFDKDFPECKVIKLEQNYRSTKTIISAASSLIKHNNLRNNKQLFTDNSKGSPIYIYELEDEYKEAHLIVDTIRNHCINDDYAFEEFAVFYRTNAQSRVIEDVLRSNGVPYKIVGNLKFYDRTEIKDILSYLSFILNPNNETALRRIINSPKRGIGKTTVDKITHYSQVLKKSFYETLIHLADTKEIKASSRSVIIEFIKTIEDLKNKMDSMSISDFYKEILNKTGYLNQLKEHNSIESAGRIENLQELVNVIVQFETNHPNGTLETFLEEMALLSPSDSEAQQSSGVTLMTLHISKGLEFNTVFISGMEKGLFPLSQNTNEENLEEERRLAYVGMTRAKKQLVISYTKKRHKFGKTQYNYPSQFISEIPDKFIKFISFASDSFIKNYSKRKYFQSHVKKSTDSCQNEGYYSQDDSYQEGRKIYHPKYGSGRIQKIEGAGEEMRITINFNNNKIKKFIAKYANFSLEY